MIFTNFGQRSNHVAVASAAISVNVRTDLNARVDASPSRGVAVVERSPVVTNDGGLINAVVTVLAPAPKGTS